MVSYYLDLEVRKMATSIKNMINEKYEIAKHLAEELHNVDCSYNGLYSIYIMMNDYEIYDMETYENLYKSGKIPSSKDAYVYIQCTSYDEYSPVNYFHPLLYDTYPLIYAYLSKHFDFQNIAPARGLKYFANVVNFFDIKQVVVEITDFDTATTNIGLPSAIRKFLGESEEYKDACTIVIEITDFDTEETGLGESEEYIDAYTIDDIDDDIDSRSLFGGYGFTDALGILLIYYTYRDTPLPEDVEKILESKYGINAKSLDKVVESIKNDYKRIFNPFRVIYDIKTNQFQVE
jgi:hypothetical protein